VQSADSPSTRNCSSAITEPRHPPAGGVRPFRRHISSEESYLQKVVPDFYVYGCYPEIEYAPPSPRHFLRNGGRVANASKLALFRRFELACATRSTSRRTGQRRPHTKLQIRTQAHSQLLDMKALRKNWLRIAKAVRNLPACMVLHNRAQKRDAVSTVPQNLAPSSCQSSHFRTAYSDLRIELYQFATPGPR